MVMGSYARKHKRIPLKALNVKLTGHYRYYGIYGNYVGLRKFYKYVLLELWRREETQRPD